MYHMVPGINGTLRLGISLSLYIYIYILKRCNPIRSTFNQWKENTSRSFFILFKEALLTRNHSRACFYQLILIKTYVIIESNDLFDGESGNFDNAALALSPSSFAIVIAFSIPFSWTICSANSKSFGSLNLVSINPPC